VLKRIVDKNKRQKFFLYFAQNVK